MNELKLTLTREEVAPMLGLALPTLRRLESEHPERLPKFVRVGRPSVYLVESVVEFLRGREGVGGVPAASMPAAATSRAMGKKKNRGRPRKTGMAGAVQ